MTNRLIDLMSDWQKENRKPLTVTQLARELGVSRQEIYDWINDNLQYYSKDMIDKICDYFNVSPGELIVRTQKPTEQEPELETSGGD